MPWKIIHLQSTEAAEGDDLAMFFAGDNFLLFIDVLLFVIPAHAGIAGEDVDEELVFLIGHGRPGRKADSGIRRNDKQYK